MSAEDKLKKINELANIYVEVGDKKVYVLKAERVAELTGKSVNAVYSSRKNGTDINDRKAVLIEIKKIIEE